jgi:hypothetical protein
VTISQEMNVSAESGWAVSVPSPQSMFSLCPPLFEWYRHRPRQRFDDTAQWTAS